MRGVGISHCVELTVDRKTTMRPKTPSSGPPRLLKMSRGITCCTAKKLNVHCFHKTRNFNANAFWLFTRQHIYFSNRIFFAEFIHNGDLFVYGAPNFQDTYQAPMHDSNGSRLIQEIENQIIFYPNKKWPDAYS